LGERGKGGKKSKQRRLFYFDGRLQDYAGWSAQCVYSPWRFLENLVVGGAAGGKKGKEVEGSSSTSYILGGTRRETGMGPGAKEKGTMVALDRRETK